MSSIYNAICAGDLDHKVAIQRKSETQSGSGAVTFTWVAFTSVWASIEPTTGKETIAAQQFQATIQAKARIRYRSDVTADMRLVYGGKNYNIEAVLPDSRFADSLLLLLSTGANSG